MKGSAELAYSCPRQTGPDEIVDAHRQADAIEVALRDLPEPYREILHLCVFEGMETAEVAQILGCKSDVARKRLSRARQQLARRIGRQPANERRS